MVITEPEQHIISEFSIEDAPFLLKLINASSIKLLGKLGFKYQKKVIPFDDNEELLLFVKQLDNKQ